MEQYIRGSIVFFTAAFVDKAGAPVTPDKAAVNLVFRDHDKVQQRVTVPMTVGGNVAEASWDSSVAMPGPVHWSVKGTGVNAIVQDGSFKLTANDANQ
jgi:hypothetical protein